MTSRMLPAWIFLLLLPVAAQAFGLGERMSGDWVAEGMRRQALSGRTTLVRKNTQAVLQDGVLVSQSRVSEFEEGTGARRDYLTAFWLRERDAGGFLLGAGTDPASTPVSLGELDGDRLIVIQHFSGDYRIRSETQFGADPDRIDYRETTFRGDTLLSETHLEYRRTH